MIFGDKSFLIMDMDKFKLKELTHLTGKSRTSCWMNDSSQNRTKIFVFLGLSLNEIGNFEQFFEFLHKMCKSSRDTQKCSKSLKAHTLLHHLASKVTV